MTRYICATTKAQKQASNAHTASLYIKVYELYTMNWNISKALDWLNLIIVNIYGQLKIQAFTNCFKNYKEKQQQI